MRMMRMLCGFAVAIVLVAPLAGCQDRPPHEPGKPVVQEGIAATDEKPRSEADGDCSALPGADELRKLLREAPGDGEIGGLFNGQKEWAATVDRSGRLCTVVAATEDPTELWLGSLAIAEAKAFTANAFSTDKKPLSTARLYTLSQPGHSLWGAGAGNPFNAKCLVAPREHGDPGEEICGGTIVFGGGLPLYRGEKRVGGLGLSGDTACADHEMAKRIRDKAGLNPPGGAFVDDITYSSVDGASVYTHPLCPNTWRNGKKIGDEQPASGY